jgi:hypothetical protein
MARPPEARVDRPGVAPVRFGKGRPQPVRVRRRHDQVDVIGHQTIGPDGCAGAARCGGDQTPVEAIVVGREKHGLAPITALGDMVGQVRHNKRAIRAMPALPSTDLRDLHSGMAQSCKLSP